MKKQKRQVLKNRLILILFLISLIVLSFVAVHLIDKKSVRYEFGAEEAEYYEIDYDSVDLQDPYLQIVNNNLPYNAQKTLEIVSVPECEGVKLDRRAAEALEDMLQAMIAENLPFFVQNGYMTQDEHRAVFENSVAVFEKSVDSESALEYAAYSVLLPGCSEHLTGLAVDITSSEDENNFKSTETYKWLVQHASEYGFVFRYTAEKETITGVYENANHLRYVGSTYSQYLNFKTLEELYAEVLSVKEQP